MSNLLNGNQVELGNVIVAENYRGEVVERRLVGGIYGTCEKWFLIDARTMELKSRTRETKEEVLEGFNIKGVFSTDVKEQGEVCRDLDNYELGDLFFIVKDGELTARMVVGGTAYDDTVYFAIDPHTGKRVSRTKASIEEVLDCYDIEFILQ